jgi:cell wall-associated NlpC family hydrolase
MPTSSHLSPLFLLAVCASVVSACGRSSNHALNRPGHRLKVAGTSHVAARDAEAADSSPLPAGVVGRRSAPGPRSIRISRSRRASLTLHPSPGAPSDAQVRRELREMEGVLRAERRSAHAAQQGGAIAADGTAGANVIARFPYILGGGHRSFVDRAYDCSGSISYALATAGLVRSPLSSAEFMQWGIPGPGRWLTVYANPGHAFMYVAGLRFDTSGRSGLFGSRWQTAPRTLAHFAVRHWPGL